MLLAKCCHMFHMLLKHLFPLYFATLRNIAKHAERYGFNSSLSFLPFCFSARRFEAHREPSCVRTSARQFSNRPWSDGNLTLTQTHTNTHTHTHTHTRTHVHSRRNAWEIEQLRKCIFCQREVKRHPKARKQPLAASCGGAAYRAPGSRRNRRGDRAVRCPLPLSNLRQHFRPPTSTHQCRKALLYLYLIYSFQ